jgi:hypothetical protein
MIMPNWAGAFTSPHCHKHLSVLNLQFSPKLQRERALGQVTNTLIYATWAQNSSSQFGGLKEPQNRCSVLAFDPNSAGLAAKTADWAIQDTIMKV